MFPSFLSASPLSRAARFEEMIYMDCFTAANHGGDMGRKRAFLGHYRVPGSRGHFCWERTKGKKRFWWSHFDIPRLLDSH